MSTDYQIMSHQDGHNVLLGAWPLAIGTDQLMSYLASEQCYTILLVQ